ncbi:MAG: hypothetical protein MHPSP_002491 [Paramarteilia canceri]
MTNQFPLAYFIKKIKLVIPQTTSFMREQNQEEKKAAKLKRSSRSESVRYLLTNTQFLLMLYYIVCLAGHWQLRRKIDNHTTDKYFYYKGKVFCVRSDHVQIDLISENLNKDDLLEFNR